MTSEEILNAGFKFKGSYPAAELYNFRKDQAFAAYLHIHFPYVEEFIALNTVAFNDAVPFAAISVKNGKAIMQLNPQRLTFLYKGIAEGRWGVSGFYQTLACLLWHEVLHVELRHFRLPGGLPKKNHDCWNVAQDMVVDNLIHSRYPGWRNLAAAVKDINAKIDEQKQGQILKKLAIGEPAAGEIPLTSLSDKDLMVYLNLLDIDCEQPPLPSIDNHEYTEPDPAGNLPSDKSSGQPGDEVPDLNIDEAIIDQLEELARARNEQNEARSFSEQELGDLLAQKTGEGRRYNLLSILRRYLRRLSFKQKANSWKKSSRKQPGKRPGAIYKKQPGEVLFIIDTSGSMRPFIETGLYGLIESLYAAFSKLATTQGSAFSRFYELEADEKIKSIYQLKNPSELKNLVKKSFRGMGNTDYRPIFNWVLGNWSKTGSMQKLPDLLLFVTDFDTDLGWLKQAKYSPFGNRLVWLNTNKMQPDVRPPLGDVCNVFPDDFGASEPYTA